MKVKVITDSTSYISQELIDKYDIEIMSLVVSFEEESFKETDISNKEFYPKMAEKGIPISSQPPIGEVEEKFKEILDAGNDIIAIYISNEFSGTFETANMVKNMIEDDYPDRKIAIIDSRSNSMQLGFSVLEAAKSITENNSFEETIERVETIIENSRFLFIPENLNYLEKGGRIGKAGALFGNALKITPILTVEDGITEVYKNVRTKRKAVTEMIDKLVHDDKEGTITQIAIHHIDREEEALELKERLSAIFDVDIVTSSIGPVIGLHVGPGAIGIVYTTKKKVSLR